MSEKLERLMNLTAALLASRRPLTREEITERVPGYEGDGEAARRAFERDKKELRDMGIPIEVALLDPAYPEDGQAYTINRDAYALPDPGLDRDELAALHLAASMVRLEGGPAVEAIWKLGGAVADVNSNAPVAALPDEQHLESLFGAVAECRTIRFDYRGERRTVDPARLLFRYGHWYVWGRDHDRGEDRSFRLDRMATAPEVGPPGAFERSDSDDDRMANPPWRMGDEEPVEVDVLVDADFAAMAVERASSDPVVEQRPDGSVVLRLRVTNHEALRTFVVAFLDHAEIIGPPAVRDAMVAWLRAFADPEVA